MVSMKTIIQKKTTACGRRRIGSQKQDGSPKVKDKPHNYPITKGKQPKGWHKRKETHDHIQISLDDYWFSLDYGLVLYTSMDLY